MSKHKVHLIIDFMPLYYKYFFKIQSGKLPRLSYSADGKIIDTTYLYYISREIEELYKSFAVHRDDVTISICFDSKDNKRKDTNELYKSSRHSVLSQVDFDNIDSLYDIFSYVYDAYKIDTYEADDLMVELAKKSIHDKVYVVSPDKDLLHLVNDKISCLRTNTVNSQKYLVNADNFDEITEQKFKVRIPYNSILLYLCTVGDKSDNVKGIYNFGNVSFRRLIEANNSYDFSKLTNKEDLIAFLNSNFTGDNLRESLESLELVYPLDVQLDIKYNNCSKEDRNKVFLKYGFRSLLC